MEDVRSFAADVHSVLVSGVMATANVNAKKVG
jgi:hypothetical protein